MADVRGHLAHERIKPSKLAELMRVDQRWVTSRLNNRTRITLHDLQRMADALGLHVSITIEVERLASPLEGEPTSDGGGLPTGRRGDATQGIRALRVGDGRS